MSSPELSPILSIDEHGQPVRPGWYDGFWPDDEFAWARYWFDGVNWRLKKDGDLSLFGNFEPAGERYRGLAQPNEESK